MPNTIVFVHGMFVTSTCWKEWQTYFQAKGYQTLAPAWPEHDPPAAAQRAKHPNDKLAALTLDDVVSHYRKILGTLDEKPILIGHSMGGLVVQLLLQEGLAVRGVAIDSAPPKGVITLKWSFLKSNWPSVNPFASVKEPIYLDENAFRYAFVNTLPPELQHAAWESEVVPESRRVGKGPTTAAARIDFHKARPPLLMIAGELDHIIPSVLNQKNFKKYQPGSVTDFKEFPGRDHFIIASPGWQEVADYVFAWIGQHAATPAANVISGS
jgi:pimeloyl-ACP methyl ester carboxylesterase